MHYIQKEAEQFFLKTIQIREQAYSEAHADLAEAIYDLATLYSKQGKEGTAQRFFGPRVGVPEDPVTGSAHCVLGPF